MKKTWADIMNISFDMVTEVTVTYRLLFRRDSKCTYPQNRIEEEIVDDYLHLCLLSFFPHLIINECLASTVAVVVVNLQVPAVRASAASVSARSIAVQVKYSYFQFSAVKS